MHLLGTSAAAVLALGLTACGGDGKTNIPTATAGSSGAQIEIGNTINYGSFGTTADIDCAQGKALNIGGSNNTLTVKGSCVNVNIGGSDNKVTLETVESEITVVGIDNAVTYTGGEPKVEDLGSGNRVTKG